MKLDTANGGKVWLLVRVGVVGGGGEMSNY